MNKTGVPLIDDTKIKSPCEIAFNLDFKILGFDFEFVVAVLRIVSHSTGSFGNLSLENFYSLYYELILE